MQDKRRPNRGRRFVEVTLRVPTERVDSVKAYVSRLAKRKEPLGRDEIVSTLRARRDIFERFGVKSVALFGSFGRDEARPLSDVDLMVTFHPGQPGGLFRYVELKHALEGLLGRPVDLVTKDRIRPRLKRNIMAECISILDDGASQT